MRVDFFTEKDVDYVFDNLWQQGMNELSALGVTAEDIRQKFKSMVGQPWSMVFKQDGIEQPSAVIIMVSIGEMKWRTSFAATEEGFKSCWFSLTKFMRRTSDIIIYKLTGGKGQIELSTISESDLNWFQSIGFELYETDGIVDKYLKKAV